MLTKHEVYNNNMNERA